jgi:acyl-CoA synthetase (AMP-forming)/AMP-acid ligase II
MGMIKVEERGIFTGYKDKEKTEKKIMHNVFRKNDTYFNTGDMLKVHENKWVSFVDRFGDTFRWKGENVSTLEVEAILSSFPAIQNSAVYGAAIPNTEGKAGMAAVTLESTLKFDIDELSQFVVSSLPSYSIPIFIRIMEELEMTSSSYKIIKTTLTKEAYDLSVVKNPIHFWDSSSKKYVPFSDSLYQDLKDGKLRI